MLPKKSKKIGEIHKVQTDWDSVIGFIIVVVFGLIALANM